MKRGLIPNIASRIPIFFWSDILSSASAKLGISTVSAIFWYFVFPSASAIWYLRSVFANSLCVLE
jgi:hypothetical protein